MGALAPGDIVRIVPVIAIADQTALCTFHGRISAQGVPPADDFDLAVFMDSLFGGTIPSFISQDATYRGTIVQKIWPLPVSLDRNSTTSAAVGLVATPSIPKQACGLTSWYGASAGPSQRGRTYWPFPGEADNTTGGVPTVGYGTTVSVLTANLLGTIPVANGGRTLSLVLGIYHRTFHTISDFVTKVERPYWATQKRRGDYGRRNPPPL